MPTFNSEAELKSYILARSYSAVNVTINKVYDIIHDVLNKFYDSYEPKYYIRTEKLLNSLVRPVIKSSGSNGVTAEVYFDASRLDYRKKNIPIKNAPLPNGYYESVAYWSDEDVLNAAMQGPVKHIWMNDTRVWDESLNILNDEVIDILKNELKKAGIPLC